MYRGRLNLPCYWRGFKRGKLPPVTGSYDYRVNVLELLTLFVLCILVANAKLYLHVTASHDCCDLQLMCTFRHKPLPKTDTLLTI